jgi:gamma-glutamyltranspeptidase/glutathione hydrolase
MLAGACDGSPAPRVASAPSGVTAAPPTSGSAEAPDAALPVPPPGSSAWLLPAAAALPEPKVSLEPGGKASVRGEYGVVTSVEENATRAGIRVLELGGNAVDAAVAVAYALAVTHPSAGNIGGGGFMLVRPQGGPTVAIDFREIAPAALTRPKFDAMIKAGAWGPAAVGVPGSVAGLNLARERFGKLPLATLIKPAIELARRGHRIGARQAAVLSWSWPVLSRDPAARAMFADSDGKKPLAEGSVLTRADLAATLERIAREGDAGFYRGKTAQALVKGLAGGGITLDDLAAYRAAVREPIRFRYRGLTVETMPPPSAGGVALAQTLLMLEQLGAQRLPAGSADELHLFIEASRRAHAERRFGVRDPDGWEPGGLSARVQRWTDPLYLLARSPRIDPTRATPSAAVHPLYAAAVLELEHTTHLSVADRDGMVVSLTTTLSASFGARIAAAGTGVVLNNSLAAFGTAGESQPAPGRRTTSSMAPTLVLKDDKPVLVLGTPGGDTIPSTLVQLLRHVVDHGMTLDAAVAAPRIHHGFAPDEVRFERPRSPPKAVLDELSRRGHRLSKTTKVMGDANSILLAGGAAWAVADRREGGRALAAKKPAATGQAAR